MYYFNLRFHLKLILDLKVVPFFSKCKQVVNVKMLSIRLTVLSIYLRAERRQRMLVESYGRGPSGR